MAWSTPNLERTYKCNGELIRHFRTMLGLTQEQLAEVSGYTARLIRKAEASQTLSADTIEVLAESLSSDRVTVFPEDLVNSPRAFAAKFLDHMKQHDRQIVAKISDKLDNDMSAFIAGDPNVIPFSGDFATVDGFDDSWRRFYSVFSLANHPFNNSMIVADGNHAMIKLDITLIDELALSWVIFHFQFSRGKVTRFEDYFDTHQGVKRFQNRLPAQNRTH